MKKVRGKNQPSTANQKAVEIDPFLENLEKIEDQLGRPASGRGRGTDVDARLVNKVAGFGRDFNKINKLTPKDVAARFKKFKEKDRKRRNAPKLFDALADVNAVFSAHGLDPGNEDISKVAVKLAVKLLKDRKLAYEAGDGSESKKKKLDINDPNDVDCPPTDDNPSVAAQAPDELSDEKNLNREFGAHSAFSLEPNKTAMSKKIIEIMESKELSVRDAAEAWGISKSQVQRLRDGEASYEVYFGAFEAIGYNQVLEFGLKN